jgi:hypothetical protein
MNFCPSSTSEAIACIDTNVTNDIMHPPNFSQEVLRDVTLFSDAFDTVGAVSPLFDGPMNGNEWSQNASGQLFLGARGYGANDELVTLPALHGNPDAFGTWIAHIFNRGTFLTEDTVFGALNDAMIDSQYSWCQRCQLFWVHTVDSTGNNICPAQWVGPPPTFSLDGGATTQTLTCTFQGTTSNPCPAPGTTPDPNTNTCAPACPPGDFFDPLSLSCKPSIGNPG